MPYDATEHAISHGKRIAYADALAGTYLPIFGTTSMNFPESEVGKSEITNDDTPDRGKAYIPGLVEPGTISFSYRYGKTQFAAVEAVYQLARTSPTTAGKFWKFTLPDGSAGTCQGFLTKHSLPMEDGDGVLTVECEIQATSKLTFTPGA